MSRAAGCGARRRQRRAEEDEDEKTAVVAATAAAAAIAAPPPARLLHLLPAAAAAAPTTPPPRRPFSSSASAAAADERSRNGGAGRGRQQQRRRGGGGGEEGGGGGEGSCDEERRLPTTTTRRKKKRSVVARSVLQQPPRQRPLLLVLLVAVVATTMMILSPAPRFGTEQRRQRQVLVVQAAAASASSSSAADDDEDDEQSARRRWSAGKLRSKSEEAMAAGDYDGAVRLLKLAAEKEPESDRNYYRMYKLHHRKRRYVEALDAVTKAEELVLLLLQAANGGDSNNNGTDEKKNLNEYRSSKARLLVQLGQCDRAVAEYRQHLLLSSSAKSGGGGGGSGDRPSSYQEEYETASRCASSIREANRAYFDGDYKLAALLFDKALSAIEVFAADLVWLKSQSLFQLADYYGVISETGKLLKHHPHHVDAYQLRGAAYQRLGEHDQAVLHFREGLKLDPEHAACKAGHKLVKAIDKKSKKAQEAYDKGDYRTAADQWTAAMRVDETHAAYVRPTTLLVARAYSKLGKHDEAVALIEKHVEEEETLEGAWALGEALTAAERYDEAVRTYQRAAQELAPDDKKQEAQNKLREAQVALKQSKEKNYYKILEVSRTATKSEIKKAYREKALRWHPDKVSEEEKDQAEKQFQDIGEAYEVLSDEELRGKYDRGEEVFENQGGGGRGGHHTDPFQFFNSQFGGGGQRQHFQQRGNQRVHYRFH